MSGSPRFIIWYAVVLHTVWAVLLAAGPAPKFATALHPFVNVNRFALAAGFLAVAAAAGWAALQRRPTVWTLLGMLPQQGLLILSAVASASAILHRQYGDGVPRPFGFIAADQLPVILTMLAHTGAILEMHLRPPR